MVEIKEKNILVRVSARFELSGFDSSIHGLIGQVCAHRTGNENCFILKVVRQIFFFLKDFGEFMKANRLAPCSWNKKKGKSPLDKGIQVLQMKSTAILRKPWITYMC